MRPMKTQRRSRRGSRIALSAGSDDRGVSRTEGSVAKCERSVGLDPSEIVAFRYTMGTIPAAERYSGGARGVEPDFEGSRSWMT
jgi:hypothetical protein